MKRILMALSVLLLGVGFSGLLPADGLVVPPRTYSGSLAEKAQEAIIVFQDGTETESAVQDLILKIEVVGETEDFAWIVPLPSVPETAKEDAALFTELFDYVEARRARPRDQKAKSLGAIQAESAPFGAVEVLKREVVGSFEIATVRENEAGGLVPWLEKNGFRPPANAEGVLRFYREKGYLFACIKVSEAGLTEKGKAASAELHPLRFTFETGGRDGIYFPMKLTGLQSEPFDVNLYVFRSSWINDKLNGYGFQHRGFELKFRDWDSAQCEPNAGKTWSLPAEDPYLASTARLMPKTTRFFQGRHPGRKFYLTNVRARGLEADAVRAWRSDLWLFPYYVDPDFVPYDARESGVAR